MTMNGEPAQTNTDAGAEENVKQDTPPVEGQQGEAGSPEPEQSEAKPEPVEQNQGEEQEKSEGEESQEGKEQEGEGEEYDLTVPDGFELDDAMLGKFTEFASETGLSKEQAQAAMDMHTEILQQAASKQQEAYSTMRQEWVAELQKDPTFDETYQKVAGVMKQFGNDEVKAFFDTTGVGDNPHLFKMFASIADAMGEDTAVIGGASQPEKSDEEIMYD